MKTKALISFAVTAKLICVFVSHMQKAVFFQNAAHICSGLALTSRRLIGELIDPIKASKPVKNKICLQRLETALIKVMVSH